MKKILTILIVLLSLQGFSQGWAEVGAIWHYTQRTINPDLISYNTFESMANDTINGIPCKRMIEVDRYWGDSIIKTHYTYSENDSVFFFKDDEFHLLYDFGAIEGDTVIIGYYTTASGDPLLMFIDSTSTIDINGESRIIQYVTCGDGLVVEFAEEVIEGIGGTYYMFPVYDGQSYGALRCYEDSIIGLFLSPYHPNFWWNFEDCDQIITDIPELESNNKMLVYPNPFTTSTTIEYELTEPSHVQLTIYNTIGETIYVAVDCLMSQGKHTFTWTAEGLPQGMYYAVLRSDEGVSVVKLIKK
jgi:hypothetical protein